MPGPGQGGITSRPRPVRSGASEGLAVASLRAMQRGLFSADPAAPWRADAAVLARMTPERLGVAFQHGPGNQLLGLDSRAALLRRLGEVCAADPKSSALRRGPVISSITGARKAKNCRPPRFCAPCCVRLGPIWPNRLSLGGVALGDCGRHSAVPGDGIVPFHKLSQWLAYSLVEPLEAGGLRITGLDGLTGLAEYRNGGLLLDCGGDRAARRGSAGPSARSCQRACGRVAGVDRSLARPPGAEVRERLGKSAAEFPLACMLEGGSWAAGREIAFARRPDGSAPIRIVSDGTLF